MTIKEAVEFYNQQKEEIRILKEVKENVVISNSDGFRDPFGDIHICEKEVLILLDVLDKYIYILEESLNEEFNNRCQDCVKNAEEPQEGR